MIYLSAGVFAEGETDYRFLIGLLDRLLETTGVEVLGGRRFDSARPVGIDAPHELRKRRREERISAAIETYWDECTLFVVHGDGGGDPYVVRRTQIDPGLALAKTRHPDLAAAACIPVRGGFAPAGEGHFASYHRPQRAVAHQSEGSQRPSMKPW
jgi:hypothetical protein